MHSLNLPTTKVQAAVEAALTANPRQALLHTVCKRVPGFFSGAFTKFLHCDECTQLTAFYGDQPGQCWTCSASLRLSTEDKLNMEFANKAGELAAWYSSEQSAVSRESLAGSTRQEREEITDLFGHFQRELALLFGVNAVQLEGIRILTDPDDTHFFDQISHSQLCYVYPLKGRAKQKTVKLVKKPTSRVLVIELPATEEAAALNIKLSNTQIQFTNLSQYLVRYILSIHSD